MIWWNFIIKTKITFPRVTFSPRIFYEFRAWTTITPTESSHFYYIRIHEMNELSLNWMEQNKCAIWIAKGDLINYYTHIFTLVDYVFCLVICNEDDRNRLDIMRKMIVEWNIDFDWNQFSKTIIKHIKTNILRMNTWERKNRLCTFVYFAKSWTCFKVCCSRFITK